MLSTETYLQQENNSCKYLWDFVPIWNTILFTGSFFMKSKSMKIFQIRCKILLVLFI